MALRYHHTQPGTLMLVAMLIASVVTAAMAYLNPSPTARWFPWAIPLGFVLVGWLFSSLTVEVSDEEVRWHFGPGIWSYQIPLAEIASVQIVRNSWLNGFGIRMRPGFRLYNVSGLDAVELRLKSGDIRRIGTDDPQGLAASLRA
jgi:hypothetical protein